MWSRTRRGRVFTDKINVRLNEYRHKVERSRKEDRAVYAEMRAIVVAAIHEDFPGFDFNPVDVHVTPYLEGGYSVRLPVGFNAVCLRS